ncbi:MAG: group 1 truncated hemoglobin [Pyrinomonadaceae bacterium]
MKKLLFVLVLSFTALVGANTAFGQTAEKQEKSLYQRLGGYDALAAVSDDFIMRLGKSKILGRFVVGLSNDSKMKLRQHFVEFLCNATGGSCVYTGRDMKTVHTGLGINEEDWEESVKLLNETLDKFKVPEKERTEVLAAVSSLKEQIVEKK